MVYDTNLTNLDLSNCSGLEEINVRDNKLIKLNVNSSSLKELHAENNSLVSLDLSSSSKLEYLSVFNNNLKELNVRSQQLKTLLAYNNLLEKLDVSRTLKLETLEVQDNNLTTLKIDSSNLLKLNVANNNLTELNIWRSSKIEELLVNNNRLSKLILNDTLNNFSEESINLENNNFVSVDGYRIDNGNIYIDANDKFDLSDFIVDNDNVEYKLSGLKTEDNCYTNDKGVQVCNPKYYVVPGTELKAYYVIKYQQKEEKPTIDETSGNETGDAIEIVDKLIKIEVASILFNSDFDYYFNGDFSYDDKDDIIWNVKAGTTIAEFKNMITINSDSDKRLSLKLLNSEGDDITDDNDSLIKTGDKVQIFRMSGEGQILSKFDISVKGDVNGDSIFDAADLLLIMRHIINKNLINEKVLSLSADYDMNGIINLNDLIKMVKYFSGDGDDNE